MNILVTGAISEAGRLLRAQVGAATADKYIFSDVYPVDPENGEKLEILDPTSYEVVCGYVKEHHIDVIVNCFSYDETSEDSGNFQLANLFNAKVPENLARAMKDTEGLLVQVNSGYDANTKSYKCQFPNTKVCGEYRIADTGCRHKIIRCWTASEKTVGEIMETLRQ